MTERELTEKVNETRRQLFNQSKEFEQFQEESEDNFKKLSAKYEKELEMERAKTLKVCILIVLTKYDNALMAERINRIMA